MATGGHLGFIKKTVRFGFGGSGKHQNVNAKLSRPPKSKTDTKNDFIGLKLVKKHVSHMFL